ncbi:UDP-N-acetylenolpyruvoylglucosamine reductase [Terrimonas sp.]|uniref:UDP-N-acetylmuramate dehydrogenase n=1 Tax=Terrimonas sp. TaxID=1914338 RepID=UPI000D50C9FA|nr:UDP-N-acetylmuramate dehydrogenase [Terrimonas sp.]PVD53826.1 UDP-N-acetylenolpyruvoylglucosamine reductase [Terrimonas sp.]
MQIQENISLRQYNTFGIGAYAQYFSNFTSVDELLYITSSKKYNPALILGGGSNILLTKDVEGLVLKNGVKGIEKISEDESFIYVRAGAGENWHRFVQYCIAQNWAGLENLSLIPGNVGASPMQNIGAYGVEIKDVFHELTAVHLLDKAIKTFTASDCAFGYRESVFKRKYKGQFVITDVTYKLRKQPVFNTAYGAIQQELEKMKVKELSIQAISQAVINIRSSKLPDPAVIGNAGSFFKNPSIDKLHYTVLKEKFPAMVAYENEDGTMKLAAGWLIEHSGPGTGKSWKGYRAGDAGCHAKQALVLVNYGNATGKEIYDLSEMILQSVEEKFGVLLEREVNII